MKTVIAPIDFSTTSLNAATYAVKMLAGSHETNLILYHMYEKKNEEEVVQEQLANLLKALSMGSPLHMETMGIHGDDLIHELERVVHHRHADLVVMGITGKTGLEKVFVGNNTLRLIEKNIVPVLIIPPDASFGDIKNVAIASDFKDVRLTVPSVPIKSVLELFRPTLHIVNVDSSHYVSITEEYQKEKATMEEMFSDHNPEFYFIGMNNVLEAIEQFSKDKNIDILITIPRHHSLVSRILKGTSTKKLVYHSHIPILAVHE